MPTTLQITTAEQAALLLEMLYDAAEYASLEAERIRREVDGATVEEIEAAERSWKAKEQLRDALVPEIQQRVAELQLQQILLKDVLTQYSMTTASQIMKLLGKKGFKSSWSEVEDALEEMNEDGLVWASGLGYQAVKAGE